MNFFTLQSMEKHFLVFFKGKHCAIWGIMELFVLLYPQKQCEWHHTGGIFMSVFVTEDLDTRGKPNLYSPSTLSIIRGVYYMILS